MNFFAQHRDLSNLPNADFEFHFRRLRPLVDTLANRDKMLTEWYLQGNSVEEALQHRVYGDDHQPCQETINKLTSEYQGESPDDPKVIGIWNGAKLEKDGASFMIDIDGGNALPQQFNIDIAEQGNGLSRLGDYRSVAQVVSMVVSTYNSFYVMYGPRKYFSNMVFQDRPGVSWMLYLPHVLTANEVPEARALIPVGNGSNGSDQKGTIIVSVTDQVFDVTNQEHIKMANDIEIRLADQDLLPRFVDL